MSGKFRRLDRSQLAGGCALSLLSVLTGFFVFLYAVGLATDRTVDAQVFGRAVLIAFTLHVGCNAVLFLLISSLIAVADATEESKESEESEWTSANV